MASPPPPFEVEDQTDEDFFNKLEEEDDDFGVAGSHPAPASIARGLSNLSIADLGDAGSAAEEEDRHENGVLHPLPHKTSENNAALSSDPFTFGEGGEPVGLVPPEAPENTTTMSLDPFSFDEGDDPVGHVESIADVGSAAPSSSNNEVTLGSPVGGSGGSMSTSVKVVQWSAFSVDSQQSDVTGFGLESDFLTENSDASANILEAAVDRKFGFAKTRATDPGTYTGLPEQQDTTLFYGLAEAQATDANVNVNVNVNGSQYLENLYPGWKFDPSTGQWYQIDGYDENTNTQSESYSNLTSNKMQETLQGNVQEASGGFISDQRSELSYFQQTAQSVIGSVSEDCTTNRISNWNQLCEGSTEYPPNMVFDPQYPEWYYDTNSQQWYTLESYYQAVQMMTDTVQEQSNASNGFITKENTSMYNGGRQYEQNTEPSYNNQDDRWDWSMGNFAQPNTWQPASVNISGSLVNNQHIGNSHGSVGHAANYMDQQKDLDALAPFLNHGYGSTNSSSGFPSFIPSESSMDQYNQPKAEQGQQVHKSLGYYGQNSNDYQHQPFQSTNVLYSQLSYPHNEGRSSAGRPPHTLVTFGFGGKLIVMEDASSFGTKLDYGSQDSVGGSISILSLAEVVVDKTDTLGIMTGGCDYFSALCQQSFPGPLVGGNAATKDVNKWIDEKITNCESSITDFRKGELVRLLLSLLRISCQHYGKLRSPFGSDPSLEVSDGPESAVVKLFASARKNGSDSNEYASFTHCMQNLPPEGQIRATAVEVQNLLVSGRRTEALYRAQAGQLWGPALVLAAQLGEKFYVDTVKQMAHSQLISGSPLRTLCLLIAGQPADVFSADSSTSTGLSYAVNAPQQPAQTQANGMIDDWEENLAIITANRTKNDELVIIHLGDCLWKERREITAAHTCYLVAEANFESYSDSARLCLIGADHWKCPRTYASPEAIQRTEFYEYSKVLGNSQFILQPFQPYKIIYAYMLAEVGKITDSLRYCQASLKLLKNSNRTPEVEMWKSLLLSLEERLRTHQQGGFATNLAPAKLVGKLFTSLDKSIHRIMGAPPLPVPPTLENGVNSKENNPVVPKVVSSQSTMDMSMLIPSPPVAAISEWPGDISRKNMHSRSISEPDFGRSPNQGALKDAGSSDAQSKTSPSGGPSRFGRIGSQLLQKTIGWVSRSRPDHQAKLGESNKFYYDEKLKRWVEEGAEPPAEEAAVPPPPTTASFQNGMPNYTINNAFKTQNLSGDAEPEAKSPLPSERSSGIPPVSPSPNHFSARTPVGIRSRYVDTFNKSGQVPAKSFQSPSAPSIKPPSGAKFFIPTTPATSEQAADATGESIHKALTNEEMSMPVANETSFSSPPPMQRFSSYDNITYSSNEGQRKALQNGNGSLSSRSRAASWSGNYGDMLNPKVVEARSLGDGSGVTSPSMPTKPPNLHPGTSPLQVNGGSFGDDLHEVEL